MAYESTITFRKSAWEDSCKWGYYPSPLVPGKTARVSQAEATTRPRLLTIRYINAVNAANEFAYTAKLSFSGLALKAGSSLLLMQDRLR